MAQIKQLSPDLINKIAAGEVIERPSSVVKELIENSIDAGSTSVTCEIVAGGLEAIIITDNGFGLREDDAKMAWERHATSKISSAEDLFRISSLGFRGEALASIASVAKCEMETKARDEVEGLFLKIDDGQIVENRAHGCPEGTKISVFNLFYNTPARRKYMKTQNTEHKYITELLQEFSLTNPQISFRLVSDGKIVLDVAASTLEERIEALFGSEVAENLVPIYYCASSLQITGFVGKPIISKSNRKGQFISLNGRMIKNHLLAHAVKEGFHSMLMHGKHPWFFLKINLPESEVDVNVHPRKLEVRFLNQNEVYKTVLKSTKAALDKHMLMPKMTVDRDFVPQTTSATPIQMDLREPRGIKQHIENVNREESFKIAQAGRIEEEVPNLRAVAQIGNSYILAEDQEGLVIIDQHAAHERVMYEKLMAALREAQVVSQPVLAPQSVDFSASEADALRENVSALSEIGFGIEEFGGNTFIVTSVPADMAKKDPGELLRGMVDDIMNDGRTHSLQDKREHLLHYAACRSAIKFGQKLSLVEMQALLDQLTKIDRCETCPHGRPSMIRMTYDDLEKGFKRKNF